jgi:hypothetical protein
MRPPFPWLPTLMNEELDPIIEAIETWQSSRDGIRHRAGAWVASPRFLSCFYDNAHIPPHAREVLRREVGSKQAEETWATFRGLGVQSDGLLAKYRDLATTGKVVFAHVVIANPAFERMPDKDLPCLAVTSLEQDSASVAMAGILSGALAELYFAGDGGAARPRTARMVKDDDFRLLRRRALPPDETEGFRSVLLDVLLRKAWMPPATLPFVPLLLSPRKGGAVVQIPWYVVMDEPPGQGDHQTGVWHEIAEMGRPRPGSRSAAPRATRAAGGGPPLRGAATRPAKPPLSLRLSLLRVVSCALALVYIARIAFIQLMESTNFDSGLAGAWQSRLLAEGGIESWEALSPATIGFLTGQQVLPLLFSLLVVFAAFRRRRFLATTFLVLVALIQFGREAVPYLPLLGLALSVAPGRSRPWDSAVRRR